MPVLPKANPEKVKYPKSFDDTLQYKTVPVSILRQIIPTKGPPFVSHLSLAHDENRKSHQLEH